jgi:hypothetical protein
MRFRGSAKNPTQQTRQPHAYRVGVALICPCVFEFCRFLKQDIEANAYILIELISVFYILSFD